ncbi:Putative 8-amino-7-oxononanoate synthase [Elusimicrobium minutum Pei191]|uniref:Putative 8-amino-7-oxononanoate synthase n=1 Tax=Elusimicrobium minutum (strain Pei191) TaxID=445932 RepID=B2KDY9_ELUMP|nr:pyridoxal phosphate-dependent aminotransferase family protein [Elusimicrobium minutum]ACC98735.1 Putative 8-amino-7-oxononanoate synthase [Elusimicrobium minutum Pei191]
MADILEKCRNWKDAKMAMRMGIYGYFQPIESAQAPEVMLNGKRFIMAGSNNYLGLANDPEMKKAAKEAVEKFGTGCAGSRLLNGNTIYHDRLEEQIARFKRKEAALIFAAGYQMNLGVVSALLKKGDYAIVDKLDHASILDGVKLSEGEMVRFKHNDMADLERVLAKIPEEAGKLIVVDGVFSMEGDICPLPEIVKLANKYGAKIIVDDAHATGILGKTGRGTCEHFGLENGEVDLVVGTCSKTFGTVGGFVAGDADIIHYLRHNARSQIFSAALPPVCVASISKALDLIENDTSRRDSLFAKTEKLKKGLSELGFNLGESETPILPVIIGSNENCFKMWKALNEMGIFVNPVVSPAVPPGRALIRVTLMATHTDEQVDKIIASFAAAGKALGLIK